MSEVGIAEDLKPRVPLLAFDATLISSTRSHRPNSVTKRPKNCLKPRFSEPYTIYDNCVALRKSVESPGDQRSLWDLAEQFSLN